MYRFHQTKVDTHLFMQLQDLTTVLAKNEQLQFESSFGSFIDITENKVTAGRFWDRLPAEMQEAGAKSDVILRTLGTLHQTDVKILQQFKKDWEDSLLPKFAIQLMTLLEDIRLEDAIRKERPGTKRNFSYRRAYFHHYFTTQLQSNVTRSYATDEIFCMIYLLLFANQPDPGFPRVEKAQLEMLDSIKGHLYSVFETKHTRDNVALTEQIMRKMQQAGYTDSIHEYFILPIGHVESYEKNTLFDELTRTDPLVNDDQQEETNEENEYFDETFSTWHRENKNDDRKQNFLQFELEQGTKTSMLGGGARETEDGDQAMAAIQGTSGQSKQNDYSDKETLTKEENTSENSSESSFGKENEHAQMFTEYAETPTEDEQLQYRQFVEEIDPFKRKLAKTIQLTLEHKQDTPRTDLLFGRLSKKLLPIFLEDSPRVFYKKEQESKEFDAVFTLLIDCSASMENKMEETKRGVTLFHEVLKELRIPHEIIGFWEDANKASDSYQPNYLQYIQTVEDSLYKEQGAKIMQLEAQEDNRDGFSIRHVTKKLIPRSEKNKFLLIFSDGQPAASGYDQNGIVDTYQAVADARKHQIDVVGMFLANGQIEENDDTMMQNIYGKERIMVPDVSALPEHFTPLLKRLLLKAI
ncbi:MULTISPECIES: vWA domain-containing protein [Oceanobacillus]|uniref:vWA domain-containing protein n=1 Tax=Oceanobacillus TaxID=182709 RepID=UPI0030F8C522